MVNVDISPSVVLGVGLIGAGVSLWQIRRVKPWISKDYDVVVSCISLLVGGILIFQGWRLDPLLLFGQLMTTGAAVSFAIEALRLRSEQYENQEKAALQDVLKRTGPGGGGAGASFQLPPPDAAQQPLPPWGLGGEQGWAEERAWQQQQQQQQQQPAAGFYDFQQPASSGYEAAQQQQYGGSADGQWYFGGGADSAGTYQAAEYEASPPTEDAGFYGSAGDGSVGDGSGDDPSEVVFPASYGAGGGAGSEAWGGYEGQGQEPPQQQEPEQPWEQQEPSESGGGGGNYDMDDW